MADEVKAVNPYSELGKAFVTSILAGNRGKIEDRQIGLSERLQKYAFYIQENAKEAGEALLVNDLLDAAERLRPR